MIGPKASTDVLHALLAYIANKTSRYPELFFANDVVKQDKHSEGNV